MNLAKDLGFHSDPGCAFADEAQLLRYVNLKLAALGQPPAGVSAGGDLLSVAEPLLRSYQEKNRLLSHYLCPADWRIQQFLDDYFSTAPAGESTALPNGTFVLDRHGLARVLSLPPDADLFTSDIVSSYRVKQGVLHNPKSDRRTTQGVFHVAEGGLPIPDDKKAVPKAVFGRLLAAALQPPEVLLRLPLTSTQAKEAHLFVSLLLRPAVRPAVPGLSPEKSMEIRFFAPGSLVGNLDFVESIFGNAGDPHLPENDAALDVDHWTGHTGCVILAPHLVALKKKDLGLPPRERATERQRRDGMCWTSPDELYNDGQAFKVTCRDARGVMVTLIADNYFGYCKKEVKTQISFSANLFGGAEEEHSGGALAFPRYILGETFKQEEKLIPQNGLTLSDAAARFPDLMEMKPEGHGVDRRYADVLYVPQDAIFDLNKRRVHWTAGGQERGLTLLAAHTYVYPNGYKVALRKQVSGPAWRLVGTSAEGALCHKPSTVSGGGKSEISKSIMDAMVQRPVYVSDFSNDFDEVAKIMARDFGDRFKDPRVMKRPSRPILSPERSLGSVIKLFTPSPEYTDDFNTWLRAIPAHIKELVFSVKRHHKPEWAGRWRDHFSVDRVNGSQGHELKLDGQQIIANYLRVGYEEDGSHRIFRVRQDFCAAAKVQMEDDITVSTVVPAKDLKGLSASVANPSVKLVRNCEFRLFQRPDDAVHRGYDHQAEADIATPGVFLSNFEPLDRDGAQNIVDDAMGFDLYTEPMQDLLTSFLREGRPAYVVSSSHPRLVDGKPSKNPRYLQNRPDLMDPRSVYLAETGARLFRRLTGDVAAVFPVNAVLAGRRNNPPDPKAGLPPLAVFNPLHYQELPELFMDFISSLTGKSPSTTGFGSEGALTKGPFNALWAVVDLNNALVSYILTGYAGFTSAAGHIGPNIQVDHDISLLVPEIWCRLTPPERDPQFLIANGHLEKVADFEFEGRKIPASQLGYRITDRFVRGFLGRIFNNPNVVFTDEMLKPEKQDLGLFVQGIEAIVTSHRRVAASYFADGSIAAACPPLKALLTLMAEGEFEGKGASHPDIRALFTRASLLESDWYRDRLQAQQTKDSALWRRHVAALQEAVNDPERRDCLGKGVLQERLRAARLELKAAESADFPSRLIGALGADPCLLDAASSPSQKSATSSRR